MPIESDTALEPIPRPGNGGHVRLVRKLVSDPPMALDEINTTHGQICSLGVGTLWRAVCDSNGMDVAGDLAATQAKTQSIRLF